MAQYLLGALKKTEKLKLEFYKNKKRMEIKKEGKAITHEEEIDMV